MRIKYLAIILSLSLFPFALTAQGGNLLDNYSKLSSDEQKSIDSLVDVCGDSTLTEYVESKDGLAHVLARLSQDNKSAPQTIDCAAVGIGPYTAAKVAAKIQQAKNSCVNNLSSKVGIDKKRVTDLIYHQQVQACEKAGKGVMSTQCLKDISCNFGRSIMASVDGSTGFASTGMNWMAKKFAPSIASQTASCLSNAQGNCLSSIQKGLLKDLWGAVEGVAKLVVGAPVVAYKLIKGTINGDVESWIARKSIAVGKLSASQLIRFFKDPYGFIMDTVQHAMNWVMEEASKIAGEAGKGWRCASCDALMNTSCTIMGYAGGEVLMACLTGGALNLLGKSEKVVQAMMWTAQTARALQEYKAVRALTKIGSALVYVIGKPLLALNEVPGIKQFTILNEKAFTAGANASEAFYVEAKNAALIASVEKQTGKLSLADKALVADHPTFFTDPKNASETLSTLKKTQSEKNALANVETFTHGPYQTTVKNHEVIIEPTKFNPVKGHELETHALNKVAESLHEIDGYSLKVSTSPKIDYGNKIGVYDPRTKSVYLNPAIARNPEKYEAELKELMGKVHNSCGGIR